MRKNCGFTLAEVLIILGIIGVVAALTMPTFIANHKKKVVVTRMQKFYSSMNQALKLSEVQNSEYQYWDEISPIGYNSDMMYSWYQRYLADYIKSNDVEKTADGILVANTDGSAFGLYNSSSSKVIPHIVFCPEYKGCKEFLKSNNNKIVGALDGKNTFLFYIDDGKLNSYGLSANLTREQAKDSGGKQACSQTHKRYCALLIQMDGWQIADDYPVRF